VPWYEVVALLVAGLAAGTINTIVGAGTLITFPTLLFFGFPPLVANVSNTVGLVAGGLVGFWTTSTVEIWHPDNPAALAAILGVGEVERMDTGTGFAECGLLDREKKVLRVRNRNPRSGPPRVFPGRTTGGYQPGPGPAGGVAALAHGGRGRTA